MKKNATVFVLLMGVALLSACGRQSTPSMLNTARPQLINETHMEQVAVEDADKGYLSRVADNYARYGADTLQLSLVYDPASKTYDATNAFKDLGVIKSQLSVMGVGRIKGDIVKQEGAAPTLMISYDAVMAKAPDKCRTMPGFNDGLTTGEIGDYRFGCSIDSMLANQIYRPADLAGKAGHDPADARKATNTVEYYRQVTQDEAEGELNRIGRGDISGQ